MHAFIVAVHCYGSLFSSVFFNGSLVLGVSACFGEDLPIYGPSFGRQVLLGSWLVTTLANFLDLRIHQGRLRKRQRLWFQFQVLGARLHFQMLYASFQICYSFFFIDKTISWI